MIDFGAFGNWAVEHAQTLSWFGLAAGGAGSAATAIAAWVTFFLISNRTQQTAWETTMRSILSDFWTNERIRRARYMIQYPREYEKVKALIVKFTEGNVAGFSDSDMEMIEDIDVLCSLMARVSFLGASKMTAEQKEIWYRLFVKFWIEEIKKRTELRRYIQAFWPGLLGQIDEEVREANLDAKAQPDRTGLATTRRWSDD
jgi:hypothetical protein